MDLASEKREIDELEVLTWCEENGQIPMIETSAKDAINIDMTFALAVERWKDLEELFDKPNSYSENVINLERKKSEKSASKTGCCS